MILTRGPKQGRCNICGETGALTEDHTPPKGCIKISQVELHHILVHLRAEVPRRKGRVSQNGVKYRTLCHRCNNTLLGTEYDPAFIAFVNGVGQLLQSTVALPHTLHISASPQRIMRALIGHLCAQGVDRYEKAEMTMPIRQYMLDPTESLPDSLNVYYWPYPYKHHVMARDCGLLDLKTSQNIVVWFLKFFPIAFLVTFDESEGQRLSLPCMSTHRHLGIDDHVELPISLSKLPHPYLPEAPSDTSIVFYGDEAITSYQRKRKAN